MPSHRQITSVIVTLPEWDSDDSRIVIVKVYNEDFYEKGATFSVNSYPHRGDIELMSKWVMKQIALALVESTHPL